MTQYNRSGTGLLPFERPIQGGQLGFDPVTGEYLAGAASLLVGPSAGRTLLVGAGGYDTIQAAVNAARSGAGDRIYIMPGSYNENIDVTGKDYISLIGVLAGGYARPDVVPDAGLCLDGPAQGVVVAHMRFAATADDCVRQQGNGFLFVDCVFDGDGTSAKAGLRLRGNATDDHFTASEGIIDGCLFRGNALGLVFDTAPVAVGVGETDVTVTNNKFASNTIDIATADTGTGTFSVEQSQIGPGNVFADKNKTCYIDLTTDNGGVAGDQTGAIVGNFFAADAINTTRVKMVGTGFAFAGNLDTVGLIDGSGLD